MSRMSRDWTKELEGYVSTDVEIGVAQEGGGGTKWRLSRDRPGKSFGRRKGDQRGGKVERGGGANRAEEAENRTTAEAAAASRPMGCVLGRAALRGLRPGRIVRSRLRRDNTQAQKQQQADHEFISSTSYRGLPGVESSHRLHFKESHRRPPRSFSQSRPTEPTSPAHKMHVYGRAKLAIRSALRPIRRRTIVKAIAQILLLAGAFILGIACDGWSLRAWVRILPVPPQPTTA